MRGLMLMPVFLFSLAGCIERACTEAGCDEGLTIELTYEAVAEFTYEVDISQITRTPAVVPVMHCSVSRAATRWNTLCASTYDHNETTQSIQLPAAAVHDMKNLIVTVSSGGVQVDQHMFEIEYTTFSPNGPGCGPTCTASRINVQLP